MPIFMGKHAWVIRFKVIRFKVIRFSSTHCIIYLILVKKISTGEKITPRNSV